jgi:hypothetical protein
MRERKTQSKKKKKRKKSTSLTPANKNKQKIAINLDASDPDFARSLRKLGAVQPNPTLSTSSTFQSQHPSSHFPNPYGQLQGKFPPTQQAPHRLNPALRVLQARAQLADEAEREFLQTGKTGNAGRRFLDVGALRSIITMRDQRGMSAAQIEKGLGLKSGIVARLGPKGVVGVEGILEDN